MPSYVVGGASRGLGYQFVETLSTDASNIVIGLYRSDGTAKNLLNLAQERKNVHSIKADITNIADLKSAAFATSQVTGGKLDVLVNNAVFFEGPEGHLPMTSWVDKEEHLEQHLTTSFQVNATAPALTTTIFLPLLRQGSIKKIMNLSSGLCDPEFVLASGIVTPAYAISKAALNLVTISHALALKEEGFVVFTISPGIVNTQEKPPTPQDVEIFGRMLAKCQTVYPKWSGVPDTPPDAVDKVLKVLRDIKAEQTGQFLSQKGNREWL